MSHTETNKNYLSTVEEARGFDDEYIITEAADNCNHNTSSTFFQGIFYHEIIEEDESTSSDKYLFFAYENTVTEEQIIKMLTLSNTNDSRRKDSIATKGKGIDLVMYKFSSNVLIVSCYDDQTYTYHDFNLKQQLEDCAHTDGLLGTSSNNIADKNTNKKKHCKRDDLPSSFKCFLRELRLCCKNTKINPPKSFIFLKLREEYNQTKCDLLMVMSKEVHQIKYFYKAPSIKIYFLDNNITLTNGKREYNITPIEFKDVVYLKNKQDSFTMYVKDINNKQIAYFNNNGRLKFYNFVVEGSKDRRRFMEEITEGNKLYEKIRTFTENDCIFSITFYMLDIDTLNIKKHNKSPAIKEAGVYLMTNKDMILISTTPLRTDDMVNRKIEKVGGLRFRGVVRIYDKTSFGFRPVKSETKIPEAYRLCIRNIYETINDAHYKTSWKTTDVQEQRRLKNINSDQIYKSINTRHSNLKKKIKKKQKTSTTGELYAHYIKAADGSTITKWGINKGGRGGKRAKDHETQIGKILHSNIIRAIPDSKNEQLESFIRNWCKHHPTINLLECNGQTTERFKCDYKGYVNFTDIYNNMQYIIQNRIDSHKDETSSDVWDKSMSKIEKLWKYN